MTSFGLKLSPSELAKLDALAKEAGCSKNNWLRRRIGVHQSPVDVSLEISLTPEELAELDILAKEAGCSKTNWLRERVRESWRVRSK